MKQTKLPKIWPCRRCRMRPLKKKQKLYCKSFLNNKHNKPHKRPQLLLLFQFTKHLSKSSNKKSKKKLNKKLKKCKNKKIYQNRHRKTLLLSNQKMLRLDKLIAMLLRKMIIFKQKIKKACRNQKIIRIKFQQLKRWLFQSKILFL